MSSSVQRPGKQRSRGSDVVNVGQFNAQMPNGGPGAVPPGHAFVTPVVGQQQQPWIQNPPADAPANPTIYAPTGMKVNVTPHPNYQYPTGAYNQGQQGYAPVYAPSVRPPYMYQTQYMTTPGTQYTTYPQATYPDQQYYANQHMMAPPPTIPGGAQQPIPMQQQQQAHTPVPREKKILSIVDPTTGTSVVSPSVAKPVEEKAAAAVPEPKVEEKAQDDVRKQFARQVQGLVPPGTTNRTRHGSSLSESNPVVSAPADETVPHIVPAESPAEPAIAESPTDQFEDPECEVTENIVDTIETEQPEESSPSGPVAVMVEQESTSGFVESEPIIDEHSTLAAQVAGTDDAMVSSMNELNLAENEEPSDSPTPDAAEEERRREEEDENQRRARELELEALLNQLDDDKTEVDTSAHFYNRQFMYCIRNREKEFKYTPCPKSPEELKNLGIDIGSMPKGSDAKRNKDSFNPPWSRTAPTSRPRYPGKPSTDRDRRPNKKYPQSGRNSIARPPPVELAKSDNAWKAEKLSAEDLEQEEGRIKKLLKDVRALMNKITPTTKDALINDFLSFDVSRTQEQLSAVINIIFDKAVEEPKFCPLYSEVCKKQVEKELSQNSKVSRFRNGLLNRAQSTFVTKNQEEEREKMMTAIAEETDAKKKTQLEIELQESENKFRRRKFGNITFMGQLFWQQLLSTRIVQWCLHDLLKHTHSVDNKLPEPPYDDESLHCALQLIEALGQKLEKSNEKEFNGKTYLEQTIEHLSKIAPQCSNKIRFMILNLTELRRNGWVPRKTVDSGPKTLKEIHGDIKKEQLENQAKNDQYDKKKYMGAASTTLRRNNGPPPPRSSLDNRDRAYRERPSMDRRTAAANNSKMQSSSVAPKSISLKSMDKDQSTSKKSWRGGVGGGSNDAGKRDGSDSRKNSNANPDRADALNAARAIGGGAGPLAGHRSSSQTSIASREEETEEQREDRESREREERQEQMDKIAKRISGLYNEMLQGECTLAQLEQDILKYIDNPGLGKPSPVDVFRAYAHFVSDKVPKEATDFPQQSAHLLLTIFQHKEKKDDILRGIASFMSHAVEMEYWCDCPAMWQRMAQLIVNMNCPPPEQVEEAKTSELTDEDNDAVEKPKKVQLKPAQLVDFADVFVQAKKTDDKKPYELLVLTLKLLTETLVKKMGLEESALAMQFTFDELKDVNLNREELNAELKECKPSGISAENLYALLSQQ